MFGIWYRTVYIYVDLKKKKAPWLNSAVVTLHQEGAIG